MMKKLITYSLTALATLVLVFSCTKQEVVELTVSPLTVNFDVAGGEQTVAITCNDHWTVTKDADWITIGTDKGDGNGSVKITVPENKALDTREGTVTVAAGEVKRTVSVAQLGKKPVLTVSPDALNASDEGGVLELTVTSNVEWTLTIPEDAIWVSAEKKAGEGNDVVKFTVSPNEGLEARETELVFASGNLVPVKVKLAQMGQEPFFAIDMEKVEAAYGGGTYAIAVTTNLAWALAIPEEVTWISADVTEGEKDAVVTLTVDENIFLEGREAVVVFSAGEELTVELPVSQQAGVPSHASDSLALAKIYAIADGANWKESRRWDFEKPISEWPGIKLDDDGRVIECSITNGTVTTVEWELPEEIATLTKLQTFQAVGSKVTGSFPEWLYDMTTLTKVRLNNNAIMGSLSAKIGQLTELTELFLNGNKDFGGTIPAAIGSLKQLNNFNIAETAISGAVPAELSGCDALATFVAYKSAITSLPDNLDQWPALKTFMIYGNNIEGPLPESLSRSTTITSAQMYNCNFTGNIPASYGNLPSTCNQLYLNGNKLHGLIPEAVQNHPNFNVKNRWNAAERILPQQDGYTLYLEYNHQTDSLALVAIYDAAKGANWKEERRWDLSKPINEWDGVKLTDGRVTSLAITAQGVIPEAWTLPSEVGNLTELTVLKLNQCNLSGDLPKELYSLTNLTELWLQNGKITGSFPAELGQLKKLSKFYIDRNQISGPLPAEIGELTELTMLNIANTQISGGFPAEFVNCKKMTTLMAYSTAMTELPDYWDQLPELKTVQLYGNKGFTGPLPTTFAKLKNVVSLQLKNCNFSGEIPAEYASLASACNQLYISGNQLVGTVPEGLRSHAKYSTWLKNDSNWKQQDGYGLVLTDLEGRWTAPRFSEHPDDIALVLDFSGNKLTLYIIAWGMRFEGTYTYADETVSYTITTGAKALTDVHYDVEGKMDSYSWMAGNLDASTLQLAEGYAWYDMTVATNPFNETYLEYKESLASFNLKITGADQATSSSIVIPDVVLTKVK